MKEWEKFLEASEALPDSPTADDLDALFSQAPASVLRKYADAAKARDEAATFAQLDPAVKARLDKLEADNAALTARSEADRVAKSKAAAAAFAMTVWEEKGLTVPARETLEAALFAASEAVHAGAGSTVAFSDGGVEKVTGDLRSAIEAFARAVPASPMASNVLDGNGNINERFKVVFNQTKADDPNRPMTPEERDAMLAKTEVGRTILAKRAAATNGRA